MSSGFIIADNIPQYLLRNFFKCLFIEYRVYQEMFCWLIQEVKGLSRAANSIDF